MITLKYTYDLLSFHNIQLSRRFGKALRKFSTESLPYRCYCEKNPFSDVGNGVDRKELIVSPKNSKILKAAIVGTPNAGKSTLINCICKRQIFAVSNKVHTTRCKARAACIDGETQIVFLDTPGLVTGGESKRFRLERSFLIDGEESVDEADVVCVVHDVSNRYSKNKLDPKVLRLLTSVKDKPAVLIMNKVDLLKPKASLLDIASVLTCKSKSKRGKRQREEEDESKGESRGWPHFTDVFMVSAIDGSGVDSIKEWLLSKAVSGQWALPEDWFTDQSCTKLVEDTVKSQLLESLPNEVPYQLAVRLDYLDWPDNLGMGIVTVVVSIVCKTPRIEKVVMGPGGRRVKAIAQTTEQLLRNSFRAAVRLRIAVTSKQT